MSVSRAPGASRGARGISLERMTSNIADQVLRNARVVGGPDHPVDVAICDGHIVAVEPSGSGQGRTGVDLGGRYVMPGMWDNHVHFSQWSRQRARLDTSAATSAAHVAQLVAERMAEDDDHSRTLAAFGYRDALWPDIPTAEALDAVAPSRPVVIISGDLHSAWVNSAAQRKYDIVHSGLLREEEAFVVANQLADETRDDLFVLSTYAATEAAARGVVGVVDLEIDDNLENWSRRMDEAIRTLRVEAGFYKGQLEEIIDARLVTGDIIAGTGGLLSVGPLKVISDGSLNTRTAYCHDPYPDSADHGMNNVPPDQLEVLMRDAMTARLRVAIHAIGDLANTLALDMFELTGAFGSIEHAQLVRPEDLPRFAELGVIASIQPEHAMDDRDVADTIWEGRTDRAFPMASLYQAGATLALGSDAPVAPLDPWVTFAAAFDRSRDGREPWHPEQQLEREVALGASTRYAKVEPGAVADLLVCEANPLTAPAAQVREMPIAATLLAGEFSYRDPDLV